MRADDDTDDELLPAPARLLRDFVNTAEPQTGGEELGTPAELEQWATARGLLPAAAHPGLSAAELAHAVDLREGLRAVLQSHAGHEAPSHARGALDDVLAEVPLRASFDPGGAMHLEPVADGTLAVLVAGLLDAVRRATVDGSWDRLKVCARDSCRWAFYDTSRNRSGRWCSMAGCGNTVKMQRAHARRRAAAG